MEVKTKYQLGQMVWVIEQRTSGALIVCDHCKRTKPSTPILVARQLEVLGILVHNTKAGVDYEAFDLGEDGKVIRWTSEESEIFSTEEECHTAIKARQATSESILKLVEENS